MRYEKNFSYAFIDGMQYIQNEKIVKFRENKSQIINGNIAYKGKVSGIAKIIKHPGEINKVNFGDILVTQMTSPSLIAAMNKAAAFVTDEGGITCHASIIAREMQKPCIIGTKFATQILKDGDLVEVDADNGIVTILEKASD